MCLHTYSFIGRFSPRVAVPLFILHDGDASLSGGCAGMAAGANGDAGWLGARRGSPGGPAEVPGWAAALKLSVTPPMWPPLTSAVVSAGDGAPPNTKPERTSSATVGKTGAADRPTCKLSDLGRLAPLGSVAGWSGCGGRELVGG